MGQYKGGILANAASQISKLDNYAPKELGRGVRNPEGLRRWLFGGNGILVEHNQGLSHYERMAAFRRSRVLRHYQIHGEITRQTTSIGNTKRIEGDKPDMEFREHFLAYLRTSDRETQGELCERNIRSGPDTYDHTRKPKKGGYDGNGRNVIRGTLRSRNNRNCRFVNNCDGWE